MTLHDFWKWLDKQVEEGNSIEPKLVKIELYYKGQPRHIINEYLDVDFELNPENGYVWLNNWYKGQICDIKGCIDISQIRISDFDIKERTQHLCE